MVNRFVRIILFFDLPNTTSAQRRAYTKFRKQLINDGYLMMQESVYTKLAINRQTMELEVNRLNTFLPKEGLVQVLAVTEKQYSRIKTILGETRSHNEVDSLERLLVL